MNSLCFTVIINFWIIQFWPVSVNFNLYLIVTLNDLSLPGYGIVDSKYL